MATSWKVVDQEAYAGVVSSALRIASGLGFVWPDTAKLMGIAGDVGQNPKYLEHKLLFSPTQHFEQRCALIVSLPAKLNAKFGEDNAPHHKWLETKYHELGGNTVRAAMLSGELSQLVSVLALLG